MLSFQTSLRILIKCYIRNCHKLALYHLYGIKGSPDRDSVAWSRFSVYIANSLAWWAARLALNCSFIRSAMCTGHTNNSRTLLFVCYISDLPRSINSKVRMYADSTFAYSVINSIDDCIQVQNNLLLLESDKYIWQYIMQANIW